MDTPKLARQASNRVLGTHTPLEHSPGDVQRTGNDPVRGPFVVGAQVDEQGTAVLSGQRLIWFHTVEHVPRAQE